MNWLLRNDFGDGRVSGDLVRCEKLLAEDGHVPRRLDAKSDLSTVDVDDRNADVVADVNLLPKLPAEDQHVAALPLAWRR